MAVKRQHVAVRRKVVDLTQEQLAERLGVERSTVLRWEGGETVSLPWAHQPGVVASAVDERGIHIEVYGLWRSDAW